jgi:hypothetical protein
MERWNFDRKLKKTHSKEWEKNKEFLEAPYIFYSLRFIKKSA